MTTQNDRLELCLFIMRLSVFGVMLVWTLDKFINPGHAAAVFEHFYFIKGLDATVIYGIGAVELAILLGFLIGFAKTWTYGAVLVFHAVSTLSSYKQYLDPFGEMHLLFFAAWPMLAACFTLFVLRDRDRLLSR